VPRGARGDVEVIAMTGRLVVHGSFIHFAPDGAPRTGAPTMRIWPMRRVSSVAVGQERSDASAEHWPVPSTGLEATGPSVQSVHVRLEDGAVICFPLAEHNRPAAAVAVRVLLDTL
jgi:hypothetical protein